jgi:hypothetical protein
MRLRPVWIWRLVLLGFALVYLASARLQAAVPPLLPFLCAAAVEARVRARADGERRSEIPGPSRATSTSWAGPAAR